MMFLREVNYQGGHGDEGMYLCDISLYQMINSLAMNVVGNRFSLLL